MAILNPNFAEPGPSVGLAASWTLSASTALEVIAGFGTAPESSVEDFEHWHDFVADFEQVTQVRAFFVAASLGHEPFEQGWSNDLRLTEFSVAQLEPAPLSPSNTEAFESGWSNASFAFDWSRATATCALFNGKPVEDFEEQWHNNQLFLRDWALIPSWPGMFDGGTTTKESFEGIWGFATTQ
jgi:hypothetical protein